jgi:hypothetical protein
MGTLPENKAMRITGVGHVVFAAAVCWDEAWVRGRPGTMMPKPSGMMGENGPQSPDKAHRRLV